MGHVASFGKEVLRFHIHKQSVWHMYNMHEVTLLWDFGTDYERSVEAGVRCDLLTVEQ